MAANMGGPHASRWSVPGPISGRWAGCWARYTSSPSTHDAQPAAMAQWPTKRCSAFQVPRWRMCAAACVDAWVAAGRGGGQMGVKHINSTCALSGWLCRLGLGMHPGSMWQANSTQCRVAYVDVARVAAAAPRPNRYLVSQWELDAPATRDPAAEANGCLSCALQVQYSRALPEPAWRSVVQLPSRHSSTPAGCASSPPPPTPAHTPAVPFFAPGLRQLLPAAAAGPWPPGPPPDVGFAGA